MVKAVFHQLAYRQTEGFAGSLSELLRVKLPIPDYTTMKPPGQNAENPVAHP